MSKGDNCFLFAMAMAMDLSPQTLIMHLGHDGKQAAFEGGYARGFHWNEMVDVGIVHGYAVVMIEKHPEMAPTEAHRPIATFEAQEAHDRWYGYYEDYTGVIITAHGPVMHAVAFERGMCYDPNGFQYNEMPDSEIMFLVCKMKSRY
jgi:hypothetical protein